MFTFWRAACSPKELTSSSSIVVALLQVLVYRWSMIVKAIVCTGAESDPCSLVALQPDVLRANGIKEVGVAAEVACGQGAI